MERTPPGWYDGGDGMLRWWDGTAWTAAAPPPPSPTSQSNEQVLAIVAHISALVGFSFLGPLVVYLIVRSDAERSEWVRNHAREALNFQLTLLIVSIVGVILSIVLAIVTVGVALFVLIPLWILFAIGTLVLTIIATIAAGRGEEYRYPMSIRLVR